MVHNCNQTNCKHESVKFCSHCGKVYCEKCGREWEDKCTWNHYTYWNYPTNNYPTYNQPTNVLYGTLTNTDSQGQTCPHEAK